ncbi:MAG: type II toxin-antitoxin system VapC family toxin [Phycisphaerae bacterium]
MIYMLDTNACIRHLDNPACSVGLKMIEHWQDDFTVSSITEFELYYGALGSNRPVEEVAKVRDFLLRFESVPFASHAAQLAADMRVDLERRGEMIGPFDLQIAATAIIRKATLVTHNVKEFSRVPHLQWEDWES